MAVDLEFIEGMVEMQGNDCYFRKEVVLEMVSEIRSLRSDLAAARAELAESRASIRAKEETVKMGEGRLHLP